MKKTIAQAKGCVIGKLVKKLRETNKKLENADTKPLKLTTRPAKLTDQMNYLKRTANSELASLCLVAEKSPQQVLTNPLCDNDEIALAHLRSFKTVVERVNQLKAKFGLQESDEDWRTAIREIGKKKQKKTEKVEREKRKAALKDRQTKANESEAKRSEWLIENSDAPEKREAIDKLVTEEKSNISLELPVKPKKIKDEPKKKIEVLIKPLPVAAPKVTEPPKRQVDSFFVTDSGSAYMATSEFENRIQPLGPNDGMDRRQRRAQQFGKSPASRPRPSPLPIRTQVTTQRKLLSTLTRPNFATAAKSTVAPTATDLHPSWLAKQKTQGIATFQGRKMTFSEDTDNFKAPSTAQPRIETLKPLSHEVDSAKLHPSWLAKQKLKPVISEFTGKKTTFGE